MKRLIGCLGVGQRLVSDMKADYGWWLIVISYAYFQRPEPGRGWNEMYHLMLESYVANVTTFLSKTLESDSHITLRVHNNMYSVG